MTTTTEQIAFNKDGFESFIGNLQDPDWLIALRREAFAKFEELNWPHRKQEEWMRTSIREFELGDFTLSTSKSDDLPAAVLAEGVELGGQNISFDGQACGCDLDPELSKKGVVFGGLSKVATEHPELVQKYLGSIFDPNFDRFAALHAAFWSTGTFLYVPRGVVVSQPLHALSAMSDGASDFGHTIVVLEDGAEATLLAECQSTDPKGKGLHCGAIELVVGNGANLRYVNLQDWGQGAWHFAHQKAILGRDANLQWTIGALGSRLAKVNQHVLLNGEGANTQVNGVMFTENEQHLSYHTLQHHQKHSCNSDFLYKAALQDKSRTVWRGMIKVDEGAQKTDGFQRNDNLLLSDTSRADSIPGLEIEADDVRCTHGSTSGRVDEELIFYAQCRGFTRKEAIRAIVTGFFQQVFDRITIESVRDALGYAISRRVRDYE